MGGRITKKSKEAKTLMAQWQVRLSTEKESRMNEKHTILDRESAKTSLRKYQKGYGYLWIDFRAKGKANIKALTQANCC